MLLRLLSFSVFLLFARSWPSNRTWSAIFPSCWLVGWPVLHSSTALSLSQSSCAIIIKFQFLLFPAHKRSSLNFVQPSIESYVKRHGNRKVEDSWKTGLSELHQFADFLENESRRKASSREDYGGILETSMELRVLDEPEALAGVNLEMFSAMTTKISATSRLSSRVIKALLKLSPLHSPDNPVLEPQQTTLRCS
jgi:hypothetical protein